MANPLIRPLLRASSLLHRSISFRQILGKQEPIFTTLLRHPFELHRDLPCSCRQWQWQWRSITHGTVNVVISSQGKPMFETHEIDPPKKDKFMNKKRFKLQKLKEKKQRKAANKRDPRRLGVKGDRKRKFPTAEERIKYKLQQARKKEALLIERLKRYEVPKAQGPMVKPQVLTGEERFYMKKMAQKRSNYVQVGRRGVYGGVILNMHMHWKRHETVEVICKPCKPGEVHEYADEIARLSGGIPIRVIGDDTIIFYRGKNYEQPKVMSPIDTLSKKRALEKSKYEQSLESARKFIAICEKELELYYRHVALYSDPNDRDPKAILDPPKAKNGVNKALSSTASEELQELPEYEESSDYLDCEGDGMLSEDLASASDESAEEN